jgi:tRNA nucleotidyltransferase (CCA-adding enzyme)
MLQGQLLDPHNGLQDLIEHRLRHTSSAFSEDPTRVLRGMRFCGQLDLRPYRRTVELCKLMFDRYDEIEADMIWAEWEKWAKRSIKPSRGLAFLWSTRWLHHYPELYALTRLHQEPKWHPEGSAWQHTKHVVDRMNDICNRDFIVGDEKIVHMFGALLHDVGKAVTTTVNSDGEIISPGHDEAGVEIAHSFMERIHMPIRYRNPVADMVRYHMRHINNPTAKAARRLASKLGSIGRGGWLRIVEADFSGRPPLPQGIPI